jgi:hypothetical protein
VLPWCHSPKQCDATPSLMLEHAYRLAASRYSQVREVAPRRRKEIGLGSRSKFVTGLRAETDCCHIHHDPLRPRVASRCDASGG